MVVGRKTMFDVSTPSAKVTKLCGHVIVVALVNGCDSAMALMVSVRGLTIYPNNFIWRCHTMIGSVFEPPCHKFSIMIFYGTRRTLTGSGIDPFQ